MNFTTTICAEDDGFVAACPAIDEASANLREALELFIEIADQSEVERRLRAR